jgi:dephospho-CoA kinase
MTADKLDQMLARQWPDEDKTARADFVVDTGGGIDETHAQVSAILACLGLPGGR